MSYTALYRKYRPSNFSNVVGQKVVVNILKNSLMTGHISHAYLFAGPRGTGKTSIAKIFAKAVNCLDFHNDICGKCENCINLEKNDIDIIEIDAASNNGVEEIRTIRDNVKLLPSFCKYKIYIIDEVHMLSTGAFNALLKTLEEPPSHVIFILATTEMNKIPLTVLSRCQRFDFTRLSVDDISSRLKFILNSENKSLSDDVINYISTVSDGGLRDAINLLDQVLSLENDNVTIDDIDDLNGNISKSIVNNLLNCLINSDYTEILNIINMLSSKGRNFNDLVDKMLILIRDISINKDVSNYFDKDYSTLLTKYNINHNQIMLLTKILNELKTELKNSSDQKLLVEIYFLNLSNKVNKNDQNIFSSNDVKINSQFINASNNISYTSTKESNALDSINDTFHVNLNNSVEPAVNAISFEKKPDVVSMKNNYESIKNIRVNNVLSGANKEILKAVTKEFESINDYISSKKYNFIAILLADSKIVCASDLYLMFSLNEKPSLDIFYENIKLIELLINEFFSKPYKVVGITNTEWQNTKIDYINKIKNGEKYVFIEENDVKLDMDNNNDAQDFAMDVFGEDTVSVK